MINSRSALRARFTIAAVVISLFALIGGCEIQDLGITESAEPGANTWNGWKQATPPSKWTDVSVSASYSFAINEKGELYAWGRNNDGQVGDGTTIDRSSPVKTAHP